MSELSDTQRKDAMTAMDRLDAVMKLAEANFPRSTELRIQTIGADPSASMTVPYYVLKNIVDSARRALNKDHTK